MHIEFHGAVGGVTGSNYLLVTDRARVLLEFGLFQGGNKAELANRHPPGFDIRALDAVVLSHAHIDHSGRLPLLSRNGYSGTVWCTPGTRHLCGILLPDSAHLQEHDARRWSKRHRKRGGKKETKPLYEQSDVKAVLKQMQGLAYETSEQVAPGVTLRFHDAGHILGSAIVELTVEEGGRTRTILFSGDLGTRGAPLLRDPARPGRADVLLLESTYGDRNHRSREATLEEFLGILRNAEAAGEKVIIPSFAVGRTQDLLYHLGEFFRDGLLDEMPVYVDSPMAIATTELYRNHRELFDAETWEIIDSGDRPLDFPSLGLMRTPEQSMSLNTKQGPAVIISASGMCTGGRVVHHLRHHGSHPDAHIVFVGYQANGTPGRNIVDGAREVSLMGRRTQIRAQVHTLGGFSAHADQTELVSWAAHLGAGKPRAVLVHGEDGARAALAERLRADHGWEPEIPGPGAKITL
ncbi:MAG: MBL fold metallo-hydrolase RNA specificity domain-containing protein [Planctomycetota bacterium]|jgi:metallo-beta-lactamase family protein